MFFLFFARCFFRNHFHLLRLLSLTATAADEFPEANGDAAQHAGDDQTGYDQVCYPKVIVCGPRCVDTVVDGRDSVVWFRTLGGTLADVLEGHVTGLIMPFLCLSG